MRLALGVTLIVLVGGCSKAPRIGFSASSLGNVANSVLTQHNNSQRTGAYLAETTLTSANVTPSSFGRLYERPVDGSVFAQPLYAEGVPWFFGTTVNEFYVVTTNDHVYGFDADNDGPNVAPIWELTAGSLGGGLSPAGYGMLSTPVIDPAQNALLVVGTYKDSSGNPLFKLIALDLSLGTLLRSTTISGAVNGISFDPQSQINRAGLLLANGNVYIAFAAAHETQTTQPHLDYYGWVFAYNATTFAPVFVHNTFPSATGYGAGVWQAANGLAGDDGGAVYFETGNSLNHTFGAAPLFEEESFVKLDGNAGVTMKQYSPADTLTDLSPLYPGDTTARPGLFNDMEVNDVDLGSSGPLLIPNTNLLVGGGKTGILYLLDRSFLTENQTFQAFINQWTPGITPNQYPKNQGAGPHLHGGPIYYRSADGMGHLFGWSEKDYLRGYTFDYSAQKFTLTQGSIKSGSVLATGPSSMPGGALSLSAPSQLASDAIVWATLQESEDLTMCSDSNRQCDAAKGEVPGRLYAFNAATLGTPIYSDRIADSYAKFSAPLVAHGRVVLATHDNRIVVYGHNGTNSTLHWRDTFPTNAQFTPLLRGTRQELYAVNNAGRVVMNWMDTSGAIDNGQWHPWHLVDDRLYGSGGQTAFVPGSKVTAMSRTSSHVDLWATSADNRVMTNWRDDQNGGSGGVVWHSWGQITTASATAGTPIGATSSFSTHIDIFWTDPSGRVLSSFWDQSTGLWTQPFPIGGITLPAKAAVTAISRVPVGPIIIELFAVDGNGLVQHAKFSNTWSGWAQIPAGDSFRALPGSSVSAVSRYPQLVDAFAVNRATGAVSTSWAFDGSGGNYQFWSPVTNGVSTAGQTVAVILRNPDQIDLLVVDNQGHPSTSWWHANVNNNQFHPWSVISGVTVATGTPLTALATSSAMYAYVLDGGNRVDEATWPTGINALWSSWF